MDNPRRFSGTNVTVMVVAVCLAIVGAPVAVAASTGSFINITDPVTAAYKARVTPKGSLAVTPRDAVSGYNAKVDSLGRQQVTGSVAVGSLPAVSLSGTGNVVKSGDRTVLVGDGSMIAGDFFGGAVGSALTTRRLDVSAFRTTRVFASTSCGVGAMAEITVFAPLPGGSLYQLEQVVNANGPATLKSTYETPGTVLLVGLFCDGGSINSAASKAYVWGRA